PNIIGDGVNSIKALIELKNEQRSLNPRLVSCPIDVTNEVIDMIGRRGYTLETVLDQGEQLFLSTKGNISIGGDPIDVLDELPAEGKVMAVDALQDSPDLELGAVDFIINTDIESAHLAAVLEINPTAQLGGILYPIKGKARDVPAAITDHYFPETY